MENFNLSFPIEMIKKEQRIISGIATADNIDKSGDIVDFNASLEAFKNWGGNIREMHAPVAVGKAVSFEPIKVQGADGQEYNAIRVNAYISKGAQDTWEKILDGTLQAFSIGGKIMQKSKSSSKMFRGTPVNIIEKYILGELSVVDNPANALATVDIIKRNENGDLDYVLDVKDSQKEEYVSKISLDNLLLNKQENPLLNDVKYDIVLDMNEQELNKLTLLKKVVNWLVPDIQEISSTEVEVTQTPQEEEMDIEILKEALSAVVDEKLAGLSASIINEVEESMQVKIDSITKGFEASAAVLQEKLEATEKNLAEQEEQVKVLAMSGAIKKSVDPEDDDEDEALTKSVPSSVWENMYLPQGLIKSLGYKS